MDSNTELICPLSYCATKEYQQEIINYGKDIFGDKFIPLLDFLPLTDCLEILKKVDIAIFAHENQQAYGNIIQLLGMGKKVYMRKTTSYDEITQNGILVFDFDDGIDLSKLPINIAKSNHKKVCKVYSLENTINDHRKLYLSK